jgi:hypothetical protein
MTIDPTTIMPTTEPPTPPPTPTPLHCDSDDLDPNRLVPILEFPMSDCFSDTDMPLVEVQDASVKFQTCNPGLSSFTCYCNVVPEREADGTVDYTCVSNCYTCLEDGYDTVCFSINSTKRVSFGNGWWSRVDSEKIIVQFESRCQHHQYEYFFQRSNMDDTPGAGVCSLKLDDIKSCRCSVKIPYAPVEDYQCALDQENCIVMDCGEDQKTDKVDLCSGEYNISKTLAPFEIEFGRLSYWGEKHLATPIYNKTVCPGDQFPFADQRRK